jgi:chemotaxis protein CheD
MSLLLSAMTRAGAKRARIGARVFGGASVLLAREGAESVPERNVAFIHRFLREEAIAAWTFDVGGRLPRRVTFESWSGRATCELIA